MKKSKGLGDTIDKITKITGIKKVVKKVMGEDCGCEERQKKLNQMFPYSKQMTKDQKSIWERVEKQIKSGVATPESKQAMIILHKEIFNKEVKMNNCTPCIKEWIDNLRKVYKNSC
jgi:hypothetical protein